MMPRTPPPISRVPPETIVLNRSPTSLTPRAGISFATAGSSGAVSAAPQVKTRARVELPPQIEPGPGEREPTGQQPQVGAAAFPHQPERV